MKYIVALTFLISSSLLIGRCPCEGPTMAPKPAIEKTLAIIKPDAVAAKHSGEIIRLIELNGFTIADMKKMNLTRAQAQEFYGVHKGKPFYDNLVNYMTSGPAIVLVLQKEKAVTGWRELMGATNPAQAAMGTLRKQFGTSLDANAVHGSDSNENAKKEITFFFGIK